MNLFYAFLGLLMTLAGVFYFDHNVQIYRKDRDDSNLHTIRGIGTSVLLIIGGAFMLIWNLL